MTMSPGSMTALTGAGTAASNMVALPLKEHSQACCSKSNLSNTLDSRKVKQSQIIVDLSNKFKTQPNGFFFFAD